MRIDAHQHFWHYTPAGYPWISDVMPELKRSFLPGDLISSLKHHGFAGCVAVQARQDTEETAWLLGLADAEPFIRGVVGWVDLRDPAAGAELARFARHPRFVGVRHILQDEPDDDFMLGTAFRRGLRLLEDFSLAYDLLIFPRHLTRAARLVAEFPGVRFVLDHVAKPGIRAEGRSEFERDLRALAALPNVACKISGLVTEAPWRRFKSEDFAPILKIALDAFGEDRLLFGSDWPVCLLSAPLDQVVDLIVEFAARLSEPAREKLFGQNAERLYRL